jgi:hypothetical protein
MVVNHDPSERVEPAGMLSNRATQPAIHFHTRRSEYAVGVAAVDCRSVGGEADGAGRDRLLADRGELAAVADREVGDDAVGAVELVEVAAVG